MMDAPARLGVVTLASPSFDLALAAVKRQQALATLDRTGYRILGSRGLLLDRAGVLRAAGSLATAKLDLLLLLQLTCTEPAATLRLAWAIGAPVVLWGFPEARTGGPLRLNSLCGITQAAAALHGAGVPFRYLYAAPDEPGIDGRLTRYRLPVIEALAPRRGDADAEGTSRLLLDLTGEPALFMDLVEIDPATDTGVLWRGDDDAATLRPGRITLAQLSGAGDRTALIISGAEIVAAPPSFSGTSGVVRFARPVGEVLDTIMALGLEHGLGIAYGDHLPALRSLAAQRGIPAVEIA